MPAPNKSILSPARHQRGAVLMLLMLLVGVGALSLFVTGLNRATQKLERDQITAAALAQAKDALIGYAATYRDAHPDDGGNKDKLFGYLPCPDIDNDGVADSPCGSKDVSVIGRLPWRTLGLPPLRDGAGECLWYTVSGHAKNNPKTNELNWDTIGQLEIREAVTNAILAGAGDHNTPWALILAPRATINGQTRVGPASECGGSNTSTDYLEAATLSATADANSTITLGTAASMLAGSNNDQGLWITSQEIFDRIKKRKDFADDIGNLLSKLKNDLNGIGLGSLSSGLDTVLTYYSCPVEDNPGDQTDIYVRCNWKNNLKYSAQSPLTVNSEACSAVLFFVGERLASQKRATSSEKLIVSNYLEDPNATLFPNGGAYTGVSSFSGTAASADVVRCIKGLPAGATQKSFPANLSDFKATGTLVSDGGGVQVYDSGVTVNAIDKTLSIGGAAGTAGGCFWSPDATSLAGKTLRAYYDYQFSYADTYALTGNGSDRGNGFTFQMVRSDKGSPAAVCGLEANMGALAKTDGVSDPWDSRSLIIETDVHKNLASDSVENHTAIMYDGSLDHSFTNGNLTTACNGTAAGCRHGPANKFEESPNPLRHNQRIEIQTGCNSSCSNCSPADHGAPNTYVRISTWVDCANCDDITVDLLGADLITATNDRDFSTQGNWSGTNWQVMSGVLSHPVGGANAVMLPNSALTSSPTAGESYEVTVTVATTTTGRLAIAFGGASRFIRPGAGTTRIYTVRRTAISTDALTLTPDATWKGSIDNVSVRRLPTIQRCIALNSSLNSVYFGFTGGFSADENTRQEVTIRNFYLRSE